MELKCCAILHFALVFICLIRASDTRSDTSIFFNSPLSFSFLLFWLPLIGAGRLIVSQSIVSIALALAVDASGKYPVFLGAAFLFLVSCFLKIS